MRHKLTIIVLSTFIAFICSLFVMAWLSPTTPGGEVLSCIILFVFDIIVIIIVRAIYDWLTKG
jgi:uncharacterized membrane protein (DUF485 family)